MSGVSSIVASGITPTLTGNVILGNNAPITLSQNTGANTITVGIGALNSVVSVAGQGGVVDLLFNPGSGLSYDALSGNITLNTFSPNTASGNPATDACMVAQNLGSGLAWAGAGSVSTVAYLPGAVVIYSGEVFVCLVAQPVGASFPANGPNWQSISGGGGGGGSSITNAGATLSIDATGTLLFTNPDTPSFANQIILETTVPTTTPGLDAGDIILTSGANTNINLKTPTNRFIVNIENSTGNGGDVAFLTENAWGNTNAYYTGQIAYTGTASAPTGIFLCYSAVSAPVPPATTNPDPSADPSHWLPIGGGGGGSSISQAGGSVAVSSTGGITSTVAGSGSVYLVDAPVGTGDIVLTANGNTSPGTANMCVFNNSPAIITLATGSTPLQLQNAPSASTLTMTDTGSLTYTTSDIPSNINQFSVATTVPSTTPGPDAGRIDINSGSDMFLTTQGAGGIQIQTKSGDTEPAVLITPGQGSASYKGGGAIYNTGAFENNKGYGIGAVVQEVAGGASYVAKNNVAPNNTAPFNPLPSANSTDWLPLAITNSIQGGTAPDTGSITIDTSGKVIVSSTGSTSGANGGIVLQSNDGAVKIEGGSTLGITSGFLMYFTGEWFLVNAYGKGAVVRYLLNTFIALTYIPPNSPPPADDGISWWQIGQ